MNKLIPILLLIGCAHFQPAAPAPRQEFRSIYSENGIVPGSGGSINLDGPGSTSSSPTFSGLTVTAANAADGIVFTNEAEIQWPHTKAAEVGTAMVLTAAGGVQPSHDLTAGTFIWAKGGWYNGAAGKLMDSHTAPTVVACSGTAASVTSANGSVAFQFDVGTSCAGESTATITLPAATTGWVCTCSSTTADRMIQQKVASSTTAVVMTNIVISTGAAGDFTDGADLFCGCRAY